MEKNKNGIFYATVGVAALIVAIIGATFAYFTASVSNNSVISGAAASASLTLNVALESESATGPMVPQLESALPSALYGAGSGSCVDDNGNTVCKVYSVALTNNGTAVSELYGSLTFTFTDGSFANLKWREIDRPENLGSHESAIAATSATQGNFKSHILVNPGETKTYYFVVWINETNLPQDATDSGSFAATLAFNSAAGSGVTSTITSDTSESTGLL